MKKQEISDEGVPKLLPNIMLFAITLALIAIAIGGIFLFLHLKSSYH